MKEIFAVDVGATGTKAALVDLEKGTLTTERIKYATPENAGPTDLVPIIKQLLADLNYTEGIIGIGFPSIIKNGVCRSATNINKTFIGQDLNRLFTQSLGHPCYCVNDADAAGMAELHYGNIQNASGTVLMLTLGTGIGSALFRKGVLLPNVELGLLRYKKGITEEYASNGARKRKELSWEDWGTELNAVLAYYEKIVSPDLIILGGGVSKKLEKYKKYLETTVPIVPAKHLNAAGVIGAAYYANTVANKS